MYLTRTRNVENLTPADVEALAARVSGASYAGNVYAYAEYRNGKLHFRLGVVSSRMAGSRKSHNGRRLSAACWHAHRDVMAALFEAYPTVTLNTGRARYQGKADFLASFEATGDENIGSLFEPMCYRDACDCEND